MNVHDIAKQVKADSHILATISLETRNNAMAEIAKELWSKKDEIIAANELDLKAGKEENLATPIMKRLLFDEKKLADAIGGIKELIAMPDIIGKLLMKRELDSDLILRKVTCPIGVIGVIFESRPDALVQIAALCLKSGNCAILKGGSEAANTNRMLYEIIHSAGASAGLPDGFLTLLESRSQIKEMLGCYKYIDLIIPRGSNEFVKYIMDNSDIPVMGHSDGICHIYVDKNANITKAIPVIRDSKVQYVAACNATETVLVHKDVAEELLPQLEEELKKYNVEIRGCDKARAILPEIKQADDDDYATEYLDYIVTIKIIEDIEEAINHINTYGSHHTDCIIIKDDEAAEKFMTAVDSSGVYRNCSTRFADGYRYGFGAEVGISTGKLHARGPVGLEGLVTYKYLVCGNGNIVEDYAEGRKSFHFKDIVK